MFYLSFLFYIDVVKIQIMRAVFICFLFFLLFCPGFLMAKDYKASLFGIKSDGVTLNTRSIQKAIDYIHENGGGRLIFNVGRYQTGSIHLKSDVTIYLDEGAVLVGSLNPFDYDIQNSTALILAKDQSNIAIEGDGMIDGRGRDVANNLVNLIQSGVVKDPLRNDRPQEGIRPMIFYLRSCTNVSVKGITLRNSASWVQTYDQCKNLNIDHVTVDSKAYWNNDGMDIVDCDGVNITNSFVDASDDGICLKSHDAKSICQNVVIRNCTVRSSASGFKFGTASFGGFRNVRIINNKVFDTYRSAITFAAVDGGVVENIEVDSLLAVHTGNAVFLRIGARKTDRKGKMDNIRISNVEVEIPMTKPDAGYDYEGPVEDTPRNISPAIIITGLPGVPITGVTLKNIRISHPGGGNTMIAKVALNELDKVPEQADCYPEFSMFDELPAWGVYIRHASGIVLEHVLLQCGKTDYRTAVVLDDVHDGSFKSLQVKGFGKKSSVYSYHSDHIVNQ